MLLFSSFCVGQNTIETCASHNSSHLFSGLERGHRNNRQQRDFGRGLHHGLGGTPQPLAASGGVHDLPDDARHPADAPGMSPRLRAEQQGQDRVQAPPQLVHSNCQGHGLPGGQEAGSQGPGGKECPCSDTVMRQGKPCVFLLATKRLGIFKNFL